MFTRKRSEPPVIIVRPRIDMDADQLDRLKREIEGLLIESGYDDDEMEIFVGARN